MTWCAVATDFGRQMQAITKKTSDKLDDAVRKISIELFRKVILRSPVDTGRFRANWQVAIGSIPAGTLELTDATGQATISRVQSVALRLEAGSTITLMNNLPYGPRLESGYSAQAPTGMVALTVQEFQGIARQIGLELVRI